MKLNQNTALLLSLGCLWPLLAACGQAPGGDKQTEGSGAHEGENNEMDFTQGATLNEEQRRLANIQTAPSIAGELTTSMILSAVAEQDLDQQSHVNSPLPGVIVEVQAVLGNEVEIGDAMCTIRSAPLAQAVADLRAVKIDLDGALQLQEREQNLLTRGVEIAQDAVDRETKLSQQGFGTARQIADAEAALQTAELSLDRRVLELEQQIAKTRIHIDAVRTRIESWGFDKDLADTKEGAMGIYTLFAQSKGVVLERHITPGEAVDSQTQLFLIQGMEEVWMLASVFENQLRYLDEGASARVRFSAFPSLVMEGVVDHIHHDLDHDTRSVKARIKVRNRPLEGKTEPHPLLPGMFGSVEIDTEKRAVKVAIPTISILMDGDREYVFTMNAKGLVKQKFIETGLRTGSQVEVLKGLSAGENVVVQGLFQLKSMLNMDSIGDHDH